MELVNRRSTLEPKYFSSLSQAHSKTKRLRQCQVRIGIEYRAEEFRLNDIGNVVTLNRSEE